MISERLARLDVHEVTALDAGDPPRSAHARAAPSEPSAAGR